PWTRAAVFSGVKGRASAFLRALSESGEFLASEAGRPWLTEAANLVGVERDPSAITSLAERFTEENTVTRSGLVCLLALNRGVRRGGTRLEKVAGKTVLERIQARCRAMGERVADSSITAEARLEAVQWLELAPPDLALEALPPLLDARQLSALAVAALR